MRSTDIDRDLVGNSYEKPIRTNGPRSLRRALHIVNGDLYSGAERVQDLLAYRLHEFGYQVRFAVLKPGLFNKKRMAKDAPLERFYMRNRFDVSVAFRVAEHVRKDGIDIIHTHTPRSGLIGVLASRISGRPLVHHLHSPTSRDTEFWLRNKINARIEAFVYRASRRIIPVSKSLAGYLEDYSVPSRKITVIPNGVPICSPNDTIRSRRPLSETVSVGCMALFRPRKGLEVLLKAVSSIIGKGFKVRLLAFGDFVDSEYEHRIKRYVEELQIEDAVEWRGFVDDVRGAFAEMDIFVLPSLYGEGMPMVILEAMAYGVPVIASAVEGASEAIDDGVTGILVKPGDSQDLCRKISDAITGIHDLESISMQAMHKQKECFSDISMAESVARVYNEVLGHA